MVFIRPSKTEIWDPNFWVILLKSNLNRSLQQKSAAVEFWYIFEIIFVFTVNNLLENGNFY